MQVKKLHLMLTEAEVSQVTKVLPHSQQKTLMQQEAFPARVYGSRALQKGTAARVAVPV